MSEFYWDARERTNIDDRLRGMNAFIRQYGQMPRFPIPPKAETAGFAVGWEVAKQAYRPRPS